jgi:hypothetical protein
LESTPAIKPQQKPPSKTSAPGVRDSPATRPTPNPY